MLKGVNRQVLEISQPESPYFEKILLFVKPEFSGLPAARLSRQAKRAASGCASPPQKKERRDHARLAKWLRLLLPALVGAGLGALAQEMVTGG